ncbi:hypothetical protein WA026_008489 [Henosepilachna vigintioctopunctata]|uniref:Uncharacterized protein n=1 Tax=Henosepilachna vigintioctopunctata TaxID=420089 RepID=A0AAW1UIR8_9CUCU
METNGFNRLYHKGQLIEVRVQTCIKTFLEAEAIYRPISNSLQFPSKSYISESSWKFIEDKNSSGECKSNSYLNILASYDVITFVVKKAFQLCSKSHGKALTVATPLLGISMASLIFVLDII